MLANNNVCYLLCCGRLWLLSLWLICASSCTFQHAQYTVNSSLASAGLRDNHYIQRQADWVFSSDVRIAIAPAYLSDSHAAPRTLSQLNRLLYVTFARQFPHTKMLDMTLVDYQLPPQANIQAGFGLAASDPSHAIRQAFASGCELIAIAKLTRVENNLNTWDEVLEGPHQHPGKKRSTDKLQVQLLIYETYTSRLIDRVTLHSEGAYLKSGDDIPLHLIEPGLIHLVDNMAGMPAAHLM